MRQFNVPELVTEIIKDCCEIILEPIDIGFAEPIYVMLQIGDPDYPEDEMEIAFDGKLLKTTIYLWTKKLWDEHEGQGHYADGEHLSFNIYTEDGLNKLSEYVTGFCKDKKVKIQYQGKL